MCLLCYVDDIDNIKDERLNCNNCPIVNKIPNITGLQYLQCAYCPMLQNIYNIYGLKSINCKYNLSLSEIPKIQSLQTIICDNCPLLVSIYHSDELLTLSCNNCPMLKYIPNFQLLLELKCNNCPNLMYMPDFQSLELLECNNCPNLMYIPKMQSLESLECVDCPNLMYIPIVNYNNYDIDLLTKPSDECEFLINLKMKKLRINMFKLWNKYKLYKFICHLQIKYYSNPKLPYMKHYIENQLYDDDNYYNIITNNVNNNVNNNINNYSKTNNISGTLKIGYINKKNNLIWYGLKTKRNA